MCMCAREGETFYTRKITVHKDLAPKVLEHLVFNMGDQVGHKGMYQVMNEKETWRSRSFCKCYRGQTPKS